VVKDFFKKIFRSTKRLAEKTCLERLILGQVRCKTLAFHCSNVQKIIITIIITKMIFMMLSSCFKHCESSSGECRL